MTATKAQIIAQAKYDAANTRQYRLKLNLKSDADIIEALECAPISAGGKQGYIKRLIREDIERNKNSL